MIRVFKKADGRVVIENDSSAEIIKISEKEYHNFLVAIHSGEYDYSLLEIE